MYEMTAKRKARDNAQTNWEKRMFILIKRKIQKWEFKHIAEKLNVTVQAVENIYRKIEDMSVQELEDEYNKFIKGEL